MSTVLVRRLDANHDPVEGNGSADFLTDIDAVAQLIDCSLRLLQGEWWENTKAGFPLLQRIIGVAGVGNKPSLAAMIIQETILAASPFVNSISNIDFVYDSGTRSFTYVCVVNTQFGNIQTTFTPGNSASIKVR